jgi:hypothetical protein
MYACGATPIKAVTMPIAASELTSVVYKCITPTHISLYITECTSGIAFWFWMEEMNGSKPGKITVISSELGTKVRFFPLLQVQTRSWDRTCSSLSRGWKRF